MNNELKEQVKLNESIMYKSGMNLLVEETMIEDSINNNIDVLTESVIGEIKAIDELSRANIIEFRNKPIINKLSNVNVFIAEAMTAFKPTIFNTTILFEDAIEVAKKFSIVLGEDISYKDIYNGASLTTINEQLFVNYKTANLGLIDRYKNNLTRKAEICNECLFGDLFDADILTENLPAIIVSELNIK